MRRGELDFNNVTEVVDAVLADLDPLAAWSIMNSPEHQNSVMAVAMAASLIICFAGHRLLKVWLFIAGLLASALGFYTLSPTFMRFDFCCLPGTEKERLALSIGVGIVGGLLALFVLRVGIFLTGCCMGFVVSMLLMMTPLSEADFMQNVLTFSLVYIGIALSGGMLALWAQRPFLLVTTSCGGALGFFLAVDTFVHANFRAVVTEVTNHLLDAIYGQPFSPVKLDRPGYVLFGLWMALSAAGLVAQLRTSHSAPPLTVAPTAQAMAAHDGRHEVVVVLDGSGRRRGRTVLRQPPPPAPSTGAFSFLGNWFGSSSQRVYDDLDDDDADFDYDDGGGSRRRDLEAALQATRAEKYRAKMARYKLQMMQMRDKLFNKKPTRAPSGGAAGSDSSSASASDDEFPMTTGTR